MKKSSLLLALILIILLVWRFGCRVQVLAVPNKWYVSSTGNDNNDGLSPSSPWASLNKVSNASSSMVEGDTIFFKRGDVFTGSLVMKKGGSTSAPVVISAYGTGENPVLTGLIELRGWNTFGGNVWESDMLSKTVRQDVNVFTINGVPQAVGRTDWMVYQSATPTQLISSSLDGSPNYTNAQIVMRKNTFVAEKATVTSQSGSTVTYTNNIQPITNGSKSSLQNGTSGMGFFFQRFEGSLDKQGEWYFNKSTNRMKLYSTSDPSSFVTKISYVDTIINLGNMKNIVVENITVEGGNIYGLESDLSKNVQVKNCVFLNNTNAIYMWNVDDAVASGNTILYSLSRAILISNNQTKRISILNNYIWNTGQLIGMGVYNHEYSLRGIVARTGNDPNNNYVKIIGNIVKLSGNAAIQFQGSHVLVRRNWTDSMNNQIDDNGGIYTFVNNQSLNTVEYIDRIIDSNFVSNSLGAPLGSHGNKIDVTGIYLDDQSPNDTVRHNTIWNIPGNAIQLNNTKNTTIYDNTVYNSKYGIWINRKQYGRMTNNFIGQNVIFPIATDQYIAAYTNTGLNNEPYDNINQAMQGFGHMDDNYFHMYKSGGFYRYYAEKQGGEYYFPTPDMTLADWRQNALHDLNTDTISTVLGDTLYFNPSSSSKTVDFDGHKKKDIYGKTYENFASVPAWSSLILLDDLETTPTQTANIPPHKQ